MEKKKSHSFWLAIGPDFMFTEDQSHSVLLGRFKVPQGNWLYLAIFHISTFAFWAPELILLFLAYLYDYATWPSALHWPAVAWVAEEMLVRLVISGTSEVTASWVKGVGTGILKYITAGSQSPQRLFRLIKLSSLWRNCLQDRKYVYLVSTQPRVVFNTL